MKTILKDRGSVYCGMQVWETLQQSIDSLNPSKIFILVDTNTQEYCLPKLLNTLHFSSKPTIICMPNGEAHKTIGSCEDVWEELSEKGADRKSLLLNLGGGVVTDLGGFVACTFKRGIEFINIPTSLLAMVDASVGGKNGVDLGSLKNQIGVVRNPLAVFIDISFLETLPQNQINSGFAEMLKHGLIASEAYWEDLKEFDTKNKQKCETLIWESILIKDKVVTQDPMEKHTRKTLNYGHTLGHAIESYCLKASHKKELLHGEAIAVGMILANYISAKQCDLPKNMLQHTTNTLLSHFPKHTFQDDDVHAIIELLKYDKKNTRGEVNFVLLDGFANFRIDQKVNNDLIFKAFEYYKNFEI